MNYSPELKEALLRRMLPPNNESISKIAKEEGIAEQTLRNWRDKARKEGMAAPIPGMDPIAPPMAPPTTDPKNISHDHVHSPCIPADITSLAV